MYDEVYARLHSWLVRRTTAYGQLFTTLSDRVARGDYPREMPALLVPSSTGELLPRVAAGASRWHCVDYAPACLAACERALPGVALHLADVDREWPFAPAQFGLSVSVHALHFLPHPELLVERVSAALAPGGLAIWAVFQGDGAVNESTGAAARRLLRAKGAREAANFLPWKVLDAAMLAAARRRHHFWSAAQLRALLERHGLDVESIEPAFNGCSWLACARRGAAR